MRVIGVVFFFFFSSRRRHTRCGRDWSSDVCSSDLWVIITTATRGSALAIAVVLGGLVNGREIGKVFLQLTCRREAPRPQSRAGPGRSEERRVGKEWRCRCATEH